MTSLARQLEQLKTPVTDALGAERQIVSFLFDRKQAGALDREKFYQIGLSGLKQLKEIDSDIDCYEPDLFSEDKINFQRSMLSAEENEKLNNSLEKMLFVLAPYFQHTACHQVLEWLIYKYQIHSFNAKDVASIFFPYHSTNSYARLISILKVKNTEWNWLIPFAKEGVSIPFHRVLRHCKNFNYQFLSTICSIIQRAIKVVGVEYLDSKCNMYYSLFASVAIHILEENKNIDNALIGRILPVIGEGLKSKSFSFKCATMMVVTQLACSVELASDILESIIKMLLLKMKPSIFPLAIQTVVVLCQRQNVTSFPCKTWRKIIVKHEELNISSVLLDISKDTDISKFLLAVYKTMFEMLKEKEISSESMDNFFIVFKLFTDTEFLTIVDAVSLFELMFEHYGNCKSANEPIYGFDLMPKSFQIHMRGVILRFVDAFDIRRAEWIHKDMDVITKIMHDCKIEDQELGDITGNLKAQKTKKRLSTSNNMASITTSSMDDEPVKKIKIAEKEEILSNVQIVVEEKKPFKGTIQKLLGYIEGEKYEKMVWALKSFENTDYINNQPQDDLIEFAMEGFLMIIKNKAPDYHSEIKSALCKIPYNTNDVLCLLNQPKAIVTPARKKAATTSKTYFENHSPEEVEKRIITALEVFIIIESFPVNHDVILILFDILNNETNKGITDPESTSIYIQKLTLSLLIKAFDNPGSYKIKESDLKLDPLVKHIRSITNLRILRSSMMLLIAALNVSPVRVIKQIMSVFTFMGTSTVKKDNSLTLEIFEEAATALFKSVRVLDKKSKSGPKYRPNEQLIGISKVLCQSILDIPIHRRITIVRHISKCVGPTKVWIVILILFEEYCMKWQKNSEQLKNDGEIFEELCLEMISQFTPEIQFFIIHDILRYIIYLGGDKTPEHFNAKKYPNIIDREKFSMPKLRHLRFVILGFIIKLLNYKPLYDKFLPMSDEQITKNFSAVGKKLLLVIIDVDDFLTEQLNGADSKHKQDMLDGNDSTVSAMTLKYWLAICARGDVIGDKIRNLLPGNVSANIINELLNESEDKVRTGIRDKALQLLNAKLVNDGLFDTRASMVISNEYLIKFANKLKEWIIPAESKEEINRCRNAAFTLKLLVSHCQDDETIMDIFVKCMKVIDGITYLDNLMVGNVLLLASEIIKMKNMKIIILYAESLSKVCFETLIECDQTITRESINKKSSKTVVEENTLMRRRRLSKQSISGKTFEADALFICSLTCLQRITEVAIPFISSHLEKLIRIYCNLSFKYDDVPYVSFKDNSTLVPGTFGHRLNSIKHRLKMIGEAVCNIEIRVVLTPIQNILLEKGEFNPGRMSLLLKTLSEVFQNTETDQVKQYSKSLCEMFLKLFDIRKHSTSEEQDEIVTKCEINLIEAFLNLIDCLSEKSVNPIFDEIVQAMHSILRSNYLTNSSENLQLITYYTFFNKFYNVYGGLALPHFGKIFEMTPEILLKTNGRKTDHSELLLYGKHDTYDAKKASSLICAILDFIANCAMNRDFLTEERAKMIYEGVIDELENTKISGHEERCRNNLANAFYHIADSNVDLFNNEMIIMLLGKLNNESSKIRYRTLAVIEVLINKIGEGMATVLPQLLETLRGCLSDTNRRIVDETDKIIRLLNNKFRDNDTDEEDE
ncbi:Armadillo-like helical domain and BP28, C-terminal domain and Armadillo-type fold domain and U3 small nucleolar RNA-associated protein 10 family-containing protein [Strongyloides ratti]|uniref:HEAT repeat-containing protein 1 n=1 Tax=Strongyloides ratti TaxID=34506 RepID=A0A090LHS6_STRRB|nr:Armadillo-like helical domain and BP28, C-terminal domain and Armadillo-type fold domain and U3 small nucleolar RNA-associated protein 10 family-containing protein [Strongyloides ratti]CEF69366.1 Armadillo-like helical domain and BP28, C-terminal domain and Armadillo-type fold domain and U3 small nucleolar RNA-associated protein 10 family-containing protein [Strongyloides ratti]